MNQRYDTRSVPEKKEANHVVSVVHFLLHPWPQSLKGEDPKINLSWIFVSSFHNWWLAIADFGVADGETS